MPDWIVKYWVEWVFGLAIAALTAIYRRLSKKIKAEKNERETKAQEEAEKLEALMTGVRSLLSVAIMDRCKDSAKEEYCEPDTKKIITEMYNAYHGLGGNGVMTTLYNQCMTLPSFRSPDGGLR